MHLSGNDRVGLLNPSPVLHVEDGGPDCNKHRIFNNTADHMRVRVNEAVMPNAR